LLSDSKSHLRYKGGQSREAKLRNILRIIVMGTNSQYILKKEYGFSEEKEKSFKNFTNFGISKLLHFKKVIEKKIFENIKKIKEKESKI
jgi:hypothetical protein